MSRDKTTISSSYMNDMLARHGSKTIPDGSRGVIITGDSRPGSIGQKIGTHLRDQQGAVMFSFSGDIRDPQHLKMVMSPAADTLILCHGAMHLDWIEDAPIDKIKNIIDVNVTGTIMAVREFVRATIDNDYRKKIIIIGSMASKAVLNGSATYCASKAALVHFTKCAAWELAPKGFDVYIINPSNTEGTPMTEETIQGLQAYRHLSREEAEGYWAASSPRKQMLQTSDIAELVEYLMDEPGYLSGCSLDLAGGQR